MTSYAGTFGPSYLFSRIWSQLTKRQDAESNDPTLMVELALSVACEQRDDWQKPQTRPIDKTLARQSMEHLFLRDQTKVSHFVSRKFADWGVSADDVAAEAWARVIADFWSERARRRFLGLSRISTLICQMSNFIAVDELR